MSNLKIKMSAADKNELFTDRLDDQMLDIEYVQKCYHAVIRLLDEVDIRQNLQPDQNLWNVLFGVNIEGLRKRIKVNLDSLFPEYKDKFHGSLKDVIITFIKSGINDDIKDENSFAGLQEFLCTHWYVKGIQYGTGGNAFKANEKDLIDYVVDVANKYPDITDINEAIEIAKAERDGVPSKRQLKNAAESTDKEKVEYKQQIQEQKQQINELEQAVVERKEKIERLENKLAEQEDKIAELKLALERKK